MSAPVVYLERRAEVHRNVPEMIRLLLAVDGRPAKELAKALNVSPSSLSERLKGKTGITTDELAVCALFLNVSEGALFADPDAFRRELQEQIGSRALGVLLNSAQAA